MKNIKISPIIIVCFVCLLSTLIYYYPTMEYPTNLAQFNGGGKYFLDFVQKNGISLQKNQIETFGLYSNTIYIQTDNPLSAISAAIKNIILFPPNSHVTLNYSIIYYFCAALCLSLSSCLFYDPTNKKNLIDYLTIALFTLLGVPYIIYNIGGNAGVGWTLIILSLYMSTKKDARMKSLLIINLFALPLIYFTPASMLLLIMVTLLIYNLIVVGDRKLSYHLILTYTVIWFSVNLYISRARFTGVVELFSKLPLIIKEGFIQNTAGVGSGEVIPYLMSTNLSNKILLLVNSIFVAIPVIYFIYKGHKYFEKSNKMLHIIWAFTLSLIPLSFLLYFWLGMWGLARLSEWGGLLSLLTYALLMGKIPQDHKKYLTIVVILAALTSVASYTIDENRPTLYLTFEEKQSADWLIQHIQTEKSVFTDFRVAGYFVGNGHLRVTGVNNIDNPPLNKTIELIESIYYSNNGTEATLALDKVRLKNDQKMNYLLFSNQFTKKVPGIKLFDYAFKSAPKNFTEKYDMTSTTYRIYDNGNSFNYYM